MRYPREQWTTSPQEVALATQQARFLLHSVRNVVLATVNEQGNAHTTVLSRNLWPDQEFCMEEWPEAPTGRRLAMFFWSFRDTRHMQNIWNKPEQILRVQLLDAMQDIGALALHGSGSVLTLQETELELPTFNAERAKLESVPPRQLEEFADPDYPKAMVRIDFFEAEVPVRAYDPAGRWASDIALKSGFDALIGPGAAEPGQPV
jgi:hypothetical protein